MLRAKTQGYLFNFNPNPPGTSVANRMSLTGATGVLLIHTPTGAYTQIPLTLTLDNLFQRITQATDFPVAGKYQVQVKMLQSGSTWYSDIAEIEVGPILVIGEN
jgi:hypothetical protein